MKKNSQNKSSFGLIFLLIAILLIGLIFGTDVMLMVMIYGALFAVAIFVIGVTTVLVYSIMEKRKKRNDEEDENLSK